MSGPGDAGKPGEAGNEPQGQRDRPRHEDLPAWSRLAAQRSASDGQDRPASPSPSAGYTYLSYLIGGMLLYGGIGWLVGRWTGEPVLFPVGMIVGLALSVALIIFRVTRS
jgi:ATP synthase protein I